MGANGASFFPFVAQIFVHVKLRRNVCFMSSIHASYLFIGVLMFAYLAGIHAYVGNHTLFGVASGTYSLLGRVRTLSHRAPICIPFIASSLRLGATMDGRRVAHQVGLDSEAR